MPGSTRRLYACIAAALVTLLGACGGAEPEPMSDYNLKVVGSISSRPLSFSGSYQFMRDAKRITRDFSGVGNVSENFSAHELVYVRVQGTNRDGIYSLTVTRDGKVVFDSPATAANRPIIYSTESGPSR